MAGQLIWSNVAPGQPGATVTATGGSGRIDLTGAGPAGSFPAIGACTYTAFFFSLTTGTPTGTTPTLALHLDAFDSFGNVYADFLTALPAGFSLTTTPGSAQESFGVGLGGAALNVCPPPAVQFRWVVGGTTPSYPGVQIALYGR